MVNKGFEGDNRNIIIISKPETRFKRENYQHRRTYHERAGEQQRPRTKEPRKKHIYLKEKGEILITPGIYLLTPKKSSKHNRKSDSDRSQEKSNNKEIKREKEDRKREKGGA